MVGNSHHVLSCQPWLHRSECTCPTTTRWQSLKSCLCCTRQPEENDEPAADDLDCHKSHLTQSCCYPFNDGARGIQFSSGNPANLWILHLQHSCGHPSEELPSMSLLQKATSPVPFHSLPHWCRSSWQQSIKLCPHISLAVCTHKFPVTMGINFVSMQPPKGLF